MNKLFLSLIFAMFMGASTSQVTVEVYSLGRTQVCKVGDLVDGVDHTPEEMANFIIRTAPTRFTPPPPELFVTKNQRLMGVETYFARYAGQVSSHSVYVVKKFSITVFDMRYCPIGHTAQVFSYANLGDYIDERIQGGAEGEELTIRLQAVVSDPSYYKKQVRIIRRVLGPFSGRFLGLSCRGKIIDIFPLALNQHEVTLLASELKMDDTKQKNVAFILGWLDEHAPRSPEQIAEFERLNAG